MEYKKVKFKKTLFRKKLPVLTDSEEDYDYFIDKLNFDPVYFIFGKDGKSMKDLFVEKMTGMQMSIPYECDETDACFVIDIFDTLCVKFKEFKKDICDKFIYETSEGKMLYISTAYDI